MKKNQWSCQNNLPKLEAAVLPERVRQSVPQACRRGSGRQGFQLRVEGVELIAHHHPIVDGRMKAARFSITKRFAGFGSLAARSVNKRLIEQLPCSLYVDP